jgi:transcriptional regulator with XRE-family HTH domain
MAKKAASTGRARNERPAGLRGEVAVAIENARKAKGLNQPELAKLAGVGLGTIARCERGDVSPSLETVAAIAGALGMSPAMLMGKCPAWRRRPTRHDSAPPFDTI